MLQGILVETLWEFHKEHIRIGHGLLCYAWIELGLIDLDKWEKPIHVKTSWLKLYYVCKLCRIFFPN